MRDPSRTLQAAATLALALAMAGALIHVSRSPRYALLFSIPAAEWIGAPPVLSTDVHRALRSQLPPARFSRVFERSPGGPAPVLSVEALRGFELRVDGELLAERRFDEGNWREPTLVPLAGLAPGPHRLEVTVRNHRGPPLLRLSIGSKVRSDSSFSVQTSGNESVSAQVANDRLRPPEAVTGPVIGPALRAKGSLLLALAVLGAALSLALGPRSTRVLPWALGAALTGYWLALFSARFLSLPPYAGFDGPGHLEYVHYLLEHHRLPLAHEGSQMYQPPLFYLAAAGLLALAGGTPDRDALVLHAVPFACGLVQVVAAFGIARALFGDDRLRVGAACVFAALAPVNVVASSAVSNEPFYAAGAALALWLTVRALLAERFGTRAAIGLGAVLGAALLSKISALLPTLVAGAFLAVKSTWIDRERVARVLGRAALATAVIGAIAGGFYLRNVREYGTPAPVNWDLAMTESAWWQTPGFHTPDFFLRFGVALERPFYASFESFWDGLYTTFFGDGLLAGVVAWRHRLPVWDYEFMATGYVLALGVTLLLLVGSVRMVRHVWRGPDLRRRSAFAFLVTMAVVTLFATLLVAIDHPAYGTVHARYLLGVLPVFAVALAEGFGWAWEGLARIGAGAQAALAGFGAACAGAFVLSFLG